MYPSLVFLHIMGATVWAGGHLILALGYLPRALRTQDATLLSDFESRFERIGIPALLLQVITGLWLGWLQRPDLAAWFTLVDPLSRTLVAKFVCLALTLGLALDARLRIIPNLRPENLVGLAWHIIPVTVIAVLFVLVGAFARFGGLF